MTGRAEVVIRPYTEADLRILERTLADQRMMKYLGGPESDDKLRERHMKFVAMSLDPGLGCMFVIVTGGEDVGTVGYWERTWREKWIGRPGGWLFQCFKGGASPLSQCVS